VAKALAATATAAAAAKRHNVFMIDPLFPLAC